jgi:NAD(P)-dependent dehydrogenase (short-subunit alcohol dehydrogenase family)
MSNVLIVGSSGPVGQALIEELAPSHQVWTSSRGPLTGRAERHLIWDATAGEFPVDQLPDTLGGLVYCPGSIRLQPFHRLRDEDFSADFKLNLLGAVRVLRAALSALKAAGQASVVLFSTVAVATGMPMHASIAAAKGAVEGLTRSLAAELAPGIRVNAIAPSLTDTPLAAGLLRTERQRAAAAERHPLGRIGRPSDLAAAARFLLSEEAGWVTGQVLHVDGGMGRLRRFG